MGLISVFCVISMSITVIWQYKKHDEETSPYYMYMTMGYFCVASILSFVILGFLIHTILKTFTDNELSQEMRQLIVSQSIFVCTFLVRVVLIILVTNKRWIDFLR